MAEKFERLRERRVRSTATDVPDRYADVDEQLIRDYPELRALMEADDKPDR